MIQTAKAGGKRPGAGKPKGYKHSKTLEKLAVARAFQQRVFNHVDALYNAQFAKAVGSVMVYRVEEKAIGNGKHKKVHTLLSDPAEIKRVLDETQGEGQGIVGDKYYLVTAVAPDMKAIDSMLDRALGKAIQSIEIATPPNIDVIKGLISASAAENNLTYIEELPFWLQAAEGGAWGSTPEIVAYLETELESMTVS